MEWVENCSQLRQRFLPLGNQDQVDKRLQTYSTVPNNCHFSAIVVASGGIAMAITKIAGKEICTGQHFWIWMSIFTGSTLLSTIYSYILMPETHGLSLQEIQQLYKPIPDKVASQLSFTPLITIFLVFLRLKSILFCLG